jgi:hypothetical protein
MFIISKQKDWNYVHHHVASLEVNLTEFEGGHVGTLLQHSSGGSDEGVLASNLLQIECCLVVNV